MTLPRSSPSTRILEEILADLQALPPDVYDRVCNALLEDPASLPRRLVDQFQAIVQQQRADLDQAHEAYRALGRQFLEFLQEQNEVWRMHYAELLAEEQRERRMDLERFWKMDNPRRSNQARDEEIARKVHQDREGDSWGKLAGEYKKKQGDKHLTRSAIKQAYDRHMKWLNDVVVRWQGILSLLEGEECRTWQIRLDELLARSGAKVHPSEDLPPPSG